MLDISVLTEFLGWCTVINFGVLLFSTLAISSLGQWVRKIHSKIFYIPEENLGAMYFNYLGNYKLAILIFNLVPYIALKIMA